MGSLSTYITGGPSGGSNVRRPSSEEPELITSLCLVDHNIFMFTKKLLNTTHTYINIPQGDQTLAMDADGLYKDYIIIRSSSTVIVTRELLRSTIGMSIFAFIHVLEVIVRLIFCIATIFGLTPHISLLIVGEGIMILRIKCHGANKWQTHSLAICIFAVTPFIYH
jgi:hypothetical protein